MSGESDCERPDAYNAQRQLKYLRHILMLTKLLDVVFAYSNQLNDAEQRDRAIEKLKSFSAEHRENNHKSLVNIVNEIGRIEFIIS